MGSAYQTISQSAYLFLQPSPHLFLDHHLISNNWSKSSLTGRRIYKASAHTQGLRYQFYEWVCVLVSALIPGMSKVKRYIVSCRLLKMHCVDFAENIQFGRYGIKKMSARMIGYSGLSRQKTHQWFLTRLQVALYNDLGSRIDSWVSPLYTWQQSAIALSRSITG